MLIAEKSRFWMETN